MFRPVPARRRQSPFPFLRLSLSLRPVPRLRLWRRNAVTRLDLARLSPERLDDLGLSREAARAEAHRPFWR